MTTVGKKHDTGKLRYSLVPTGVLEGMLQVLEHGSTKYGANNWQYVDNAKERYYNALQRHLEAWRGGELLDPESGLPHLSHVMCNSMFLSHLGGSYEQII